MNISHHLQTCFFFHIMKEKHKSCFHSELKEQEITPAKERDTAAGSPALMTAAEGVRVLPPLQLSSQDGTRRNA